MSNPTVAVGPVPGDANLAYTKGVTNQDHMTEST
jgi:hypothetical protein